MSLQSPQRRSVWRAGTLFVMFILLSLSNSPHSAAAMQRLDWSLCLAPSSPSPSEPSPGSRCPTNFAVPYHSSHPILTYLQSYEMFLQLISAATPASSGKFMKVPLKRRLALQWFMNLLAPL